MKVTHRWNAEFLAHRMQIQINERAKLADDAQGASLVSTPQILIVEDNKIVQEFINHQFKTLGCDVIVAEDAQTAMALYQPTIHLALIDLDLPDLPGVTVANWIRRQEMGTDQRIPLIGHTSFLNEEVEYRCFVAGMDTAIEKLQNDKQCQTLLKVWLPQFMQVN